MKTEASSSAGAAEVLAPIGAGNAAMDGVADKRGFYETGSERIAAILGDT